MCPRLGTGTSVVRFDAFVPLFGFSYDLAVLRPVTVALLTLSLIGAACSGDDDPEDMSAVTSIPEEESTSSTTTEPRTVDPDVIPDDESLITEEYVESVLTALETVNQQAFELTRSEGVVTEDVIALVTDTSTGPRAVSAINSLSDLAASGFTPYKDDPDPVVYDVVEIHTATATCIVAFVDIDFSGAFRDAPPEPPSGRPTMELLPATEEQRASGRNPTAWVVDETPVVEDDGDMPDCRVTETG